MSARSALEQVLASHNPFRDTAVRHGFEAPDDVPEIHAEARARLRLLIEDSRRDARHMVKPTRTSSSRSAAAIVTRPVTTIIESTPPHPA